MKTMRKYFFPLYIYEENEPKENNWRNLIANIRQTLFMTQGAGVFKPDHVQPIKLHAIWFIRNTVKFNTVMFLR